MVDLIRNFVLSLSMRRIVDFGKHDSKTTYFLKSHMKPLLEEKPALRSRMRKMLKYLDRVGSNDDEE